MPYLEYKPELWSKIFVAERDNLHFLLPQFRFNVEHIGATAVANCRSFRNVDILLSVHDFKDISTVSMLLASKEYKVIEEYSTVECIVLVKRYKYEKLVSLLEWFNMQAPSLIDAMLSNHY